MRLFLGFSNTVPHFLSGYLGLKIHLVMAMKKLSENDFETLESLEKEMIVLPKVEERENQPKRKCS